jgi:hypothetical protein
MCKYIVPKIEAIVIMVVWYFEDIIRWYNFHGDIELNPTNTFGLSELSPFSLLVLSPETPHGSCWVVFQKMCAFIQFFFFVLNS